MGEGGRSLRRRAAQTSHAVDLKTHTRRKTFWCTKMNATFFGSGTVLCARAATSAAGRPLQGQNAPRGRHGSRDPARSTRGLRLRLALELNCTQQCTACSVLLSPKYAARILASAPATLIPVTMPRVPSRLQYCHRGVWRGHKRLGAVVSNSMTSVGIPMGMRSMIMRKVALQVQAQALAGPDRPVPSLLAIEALARRARTPRRHCHG